MSSGLSIGYVKCMHSHEFHLHIEAIGFRYFGEGIRIPLEPRGTLADPLINVTNTDELYAASAKLFNFDPTTMNIFPMALIYMF